MGAAEPGMEEFFEENKPPRNPLVPVGKPRPSSSVFLFLFFSRRFHVGVSLRVISPYRRSAVSCSSVHIMFLGLKRDF